MRAWIHLSVGYMLVNGLPNGNFFLGVCLRDGLYRHRLSFSQLAFCMGGKKWQSFSGAYRKICDVFPFYCIAFTKVTILEYVHLVFIIISPHKSLHFIFSRILARSPSNSISSFRSSFISSWYKTLIFPSYSICASYLWTSFQSYLAFIS